MPSTSASYSRLPESEDGVESSLKGLLEVKQEQITQWGLKRLLILNILLFVSSIGFLGISLHLKSNTKTLECVQEDSKEFLSETYSPALEAVEYETIVFNGSFMYPSIYRGPPSLQVDVAWDKISENITPIRISEETHNRTGTPTRPSSVKFQDEDGGGYMATLEINHQLHCLNMLRKFSYRDYYKSDDMFDRKPSELYHHLDHCIEMLRQRLMCTSDISIITYDWVQGWDLAYPNFNTVHQCKDFDKIIEWNYAHSVRVPVDHVVRIGNEVDLPYPP